MQRARTNKHGCWAMPGDLVKVKYSIAGQPTNNSAMAIVLDTRRPSTATMNEKTLLVSINGEEPVWRRGSFFEIEEHRDEAG